MARLAIRMPKMSMTMTEGDVSSWMVGVGDEIEVGDVVAEVMTDKVDMEVESPVAGTLVEIVHESGTVEVGAPIGWVEGEDEGGGFGDLLSEPDAEPDAEPDDTADDTADPEPEPEPEPEPAPAAEAPADTEPDDQPDDQPVDQPDEQEVVERAPEPEPSAAKVQPEPEPAPEPEPSPEPSPQGIVPAVPRARALAREKGLDLATIAGTGPDGLVRVEDVESASGPGRAAATSAPAATLAATPAATPVPARSGGAASDRRTAVRRMVARVMTPSAAVPQFTVWREIHLDAADRRRDGVSWTTVLLRGYAAALRNVPELLSRWEDDAPSETRAPSIALAVATERGLLVPTFTEPDREGASDLDAEVRAVVAAAQRGKIDPAYMGIANASLSNLGGSNVDRFQALLTPPQASVLSLGSIRQRPVAIPGGVGVALTVEAGLTVDHRVADGAHAAQLLEELARILGGQGADAS